MKFYLFGICSACLVLSMLFVSCGNKSSNSPVLESEDRNARISYIFKGDKNYCLPDIHIIKDSSTGREYLLFVKTNAVFVIEVNSEKKSF